MKTARIVLILILSLGFLAASGLFLIGYFRPKPAGILVSTTPGSNVFVNGNLVGKTPYEGTFKPGEIVLKLVPEASDKTYTSYEAKLALVARVKTVVRREFADTEGGSSGDVVSFDKEGGKEAGLVIISTPDNAQVSVDGVPRGFAPYKTSSVSSGEHQISIKSPGFSDRVLTIRTIAGYNLTIFAKLAKLPEEKKVEASQVEVKIFVEILATPTGFLRVRTEPGSAGREIDQVKPGQKYLFLEEDPETGWFKIQLEAPTAGLPEGRSGWVSNQFVKKVEEEVNLNSQI